MRKSLVSPLISLIVGCTQSSYVNDSPGLVHGSDAGHGVDTGSSASDAVTTSRPGDDASPIDDAPMGTGVDVFAGAPSYVPQTVPPSFLTFKHLFKTGKVNTGLDCMTCHDGTDPSAPLLAFGGTIYYDGDLTKGVPGAEIRVLDASGAPTSVYSDADGNFWQLGDPKAYHWPATTGVRDAKDAVSMADSFKDAGCNMAACHDGTASAPRITLPGP